MNDQNVTDYNITVEAYLSKNFLLATDPGPGKPIYDVNTFGRYWRVQATALVIKKGSTQLSDIHQVDIVSNPFTLKTITQERIDTFTDKAKDLIVENFAKILNHDFNKIPLSLGTIEI